MTAIQYFWRHPLAEQVREEGREQGLEQGREEGREEGREQGRAEAKAEMVLHILEWRELPVPDAVRERIQSCTDLNQLEAWAQRAMHVKEPAELFTTE